MNQPSARAPRPDGWHAAVPEITIAAVVTAVAAVAAYAAGGLPGAVVAVTCAAVAALVILRGIAPVPGAAPAARGQGRDTEALPVTFTGYWWRIAGLSDGTTSMTAYDARLRGTLQHLLAARLSERHGASLRDEPDAARALLCPGPRDQDLWYWVDPARPPATDTRAPGIPPRTLARLIERLEQL